MSKIWIDIHKSPNAVQKYWFVIKAKNDKLAHSEMYANKQDCIDTAKLILEAADDAVIYDETGDVASIAVEDRMIPR